jgi:hypothetical protein
MWFEAVLDLSRQELPALDDIDFVWDDEHHAVAIQMKNHEWQPADVIPVFDTLFNLATSFMSEEKIEKFRMAKNQLIARNENIGF